MTVSEHLDSVDQIQNDKWVLGVVLGLIGSVAINTGNNIQSLGLKRLNEKKELEESQIGVNEKKNNDGDDKKQKNRDLEKARKLSLFMSILRRVSQRKVRTIPDGSDETGQDESSDGSTGENPKGGNSQREKHAMLSSPTWVIGTFIFVTGSLLNFASYAYAAQSTLASLESIQFVTNLIFGKFMLGAKVTRNMLIGTCLTVSGTVLAVQFSSKEAIELNTDDIKKLYLNPAYLAYLSLIFILVVILHILYRYCERKVEKSQPVSDSDIIMPITYSVSSALFGTQSVVQAKVLAELLAVHSTGREQIFLSWFTYMTICLWLVTVAIWLKRLNGALAMFEPLLIIPLLQCSFIFFAIVSGGIFFKEFNDFNSSQWVGFCSGVLVMFCGLILLTPTNNENSKSKRILDSLPPELLNLLAMSGGTKVTGDSRIGFLRHPPLTPTTTPRKISSEPNNSLQPQQQQLSSPSETISPVVYDSGYILGNVQKVPSRGMSMTKSPDPICTTPKSNETVRKVDVRGAVLDSARYTFRETQKFLSSPNGTAVLTNAMSNTIQQKSNHIAQQEKRREKVKSLCEFISNQDQLSYEKRDEYSREVLSIVKEIRKEIAEYDLTCSPKTEPEREHDNNIVVVETDGVTQQQHIVSSSFLESDKKEKKKTPMLKLETRNGEKVDLHEIVLE